MLSTFYWDPQVWRVTCPWKSWASVILKGSLPPAFVTFIFPFSLVPSLLLLRMFFFSFLLVFKPNVGILEWRQVRKELPWGYSIPRTRHLSTSMLGVALWGEMLAGPDAVTWGHGVEGPWPWPPPLLPCLIADDWSPREWLIRMDMTLLSFWTCNIKLLG